MIDVDLILKLQKQNIVNWHKELVISQHEAPLLFVEENNQYNFLLWHEEDVARIKDIDPVRIVEAKRSIDKFNQLRNNAIEKIDEWILSFLAHRQIKSGNNLHSETPGMMIDRLSIMSLKRYHMFEETKRPEASDAHKILCANKVLVLNEQMEDLANCLRQILIKLQSGELNFKVYRQFKMYNDPALNPQLYGRLQQQL